MKKPLIIDAITGWYLLYFTVPIAEQKGKTHSDGDDDVELLSFALRIGSFEESDIR